MSKLIFLMNIYKKGEREIRIKGTLSKDNKFQKIQPEMEILRKLCSEELAGLSDDRL